GLEVPVMRSADLETRILAAQAPRGLGGDAGVAAAQVDRMAAGLAERGESPDPVGAGHPVGRLHLEGLGGETDAVAVAVDEVGPLEREAEAERFARPVEDVGV